MGYIWGFIHSMLTESFPPKPRWTAEEVPDLGGQVILITGGSSGIGLAITKVLLKRGAKVYMAARNKNQALAAIEEVKRDTKLEPVFLELDLADLDSVQRAAQEFLQKETRLDVLYLSAGVMVPPIDQVSSQGYDMTFASNVLGHFYLTKLLLPTLVSTVPRNPNGKARVISISSGAHHLRDISFPTLKDGSIRRKTSPEALYAQSKYGVVVFATELARRYGEKGIVSIAMNPGNVETGMQRHVLGFRKAMIKWMLYPIEPYGYVTHLWVGTAKETADYNGMYVIPFARLGSPRKDTQDPKIGAALWEWLEEQVSGR